MVAQLHKLSSRVVLSNLRTGTGRSSLVGLARGPSRPRRNARQQASTGDSEIPKIPSQADVLWSQPEPQTKVLTAISDDAETSRGAGDLELLQALMNMQNEGIQRMGIFGTRNMPHTHQQLVELLSFAIAQTDVKLFTSGAVGTNAAVIRGVLNANKEGNLTVILPQSLSKQPEESQELLKKVPKVIQMSENDSLKLMDASRLCNLRIIAEVQQVICFAYHDSHQMMAACTEAKQRGKIVTEFFLD